MKCLSEIQEFYDTIKRELNDDDLVVSLALSDGIYYLAISVHKSKKTQYKHGRNIQSCVISENDMAKDLNLLVNQIVSLYKNEIKESE